MRHKSVLFCLLLCFSLSLTGQQSTAELPFASDLPDSQQFLQKALSGPTPSLAAHSADVQKLVSRMTLKEKIGQMTQLEIGMISDGKGPDLKIDPVKLHKAIVEYGVGSILNVNDQAIAPQQWHQIIREIQAEAAKTRLKIPVIYGIDSIHGANYVDGATLFPQPLAMAATWNPLLMQEGSRITAAETRAAGIPWNFSPVLDIGRQPLWSRLYETFGEDPYLASLMGVAVIRGYQGSDLSDPLHVAACLKHYVGYSFPTNGHDRTPALIPERTMQEYFLPTFAAAIKAGAHTVMVNSGEVNGIPGHVNRRLLNDVLRGQLGFTGFVVSDWEDIKKLVNIHHVAATEKEATRMAVMAGIDMSMVPSDYSFADLLEQLVREGAVPVSRINEAVTRILEVKYALGLFQSPVLGMEAGTKVGSPQSREASLDAARESITLLKNEKVLPLQKGMHVLVTGPTSNSMSALNNGWSYTWQGEREALYPKDRPTILAAIKNKVGAENVTYLPGASYDKPENIAQVVAAAQQADVAIVCLGEMSYAETPGNIDDLTLPQAQLELASQIAATGKPVVLVLVEGRPRIIRQIADSAGAIVMAYNPGNEGGQAVADILFGDVNPSGKLPITYPRYPNALLTYDHKPYEDQATSFGLSAYKPQFDFGFGLSYTTFQYSGLRVAPASPHAGQAIDVSVTVKNTGDREGKEVVQLYVADRVASITPAVRRLKRFAKIDLKPGESRELRFQLSANDLSFIGRENKPVVEPGAFDIMVGTEKASFTLE